MIITSEGMDAWLSHCMGSAPKTRHKWAKNPLTGSMNMFFQTRPDTVGITKKGAMARILTTPWPQIGWSRSRASAIPRRTVMTRTPPTMISVVATAGQNELDETNRT